MISEVGMHIFTTCSLLHVFSNTWLYMRHLSENLTCTPSQLCAFKMQTKINVDGLLQLVKFLSGLTTRLIGSIGEVEQLMKCAAALS